jgi:hypothetical protein
MATIRGIEHDAVDGPKTECVGDQAMAFGDSPRQ